MVALLILASAPTSAQIGPTGTWRVEGNGPPFPWEVVLRADGAKITGMVSNCTSRPVAIDHGHLDGSTIGFRLYLGVRIGAAAQEAPVWQAAVAAESAGPRIRRTDPELQIERDFQAIADRVLAPGESDDPQEVERRTDEALAGVAAIRMPHHHGKRSARTNPRRHATKVVKRRR